MRTYRVTYCDDCEPGEFYARINANSPEEAIDRFNDMNEGTGWEAFAAKVATTPQISPRHCACHGYTDCPKVSR